MRAFRFGGRFVVCLLTTPLRILLRLVDCFRDRGTDHDRRNAVLRSVFGRCNLRHGLPTEKKYAKEDWFLQGKGDFAFLLFLGVCVRRFGISRW